ncbi:MAG: hypothetical protein AAF411_00660 [Myxococcota bacterium]
MPHHDPFSTREIDALLVPREGPHVSFFLPTSRVTPHAEHDRVVLRNQRAEAFTALTERHGLRRREAESLLLPVDGLLEDSAFWAHLSDGLALFVADGHFTSLRVASPLPERLTVAPRFVVQPLLPLLSGDGTYYVLALSANVVRVFEASRSGISALHLADLPTDLREALELRGRDPKDTTNRGWQGDEGKKRLYRKLFTRVDRVLRPMLRGEPVVLAGVDHLLPIFRRASGYARLVSDAVSGNPDELSKEQLHEKTWPLVQAIFDAPRREAIAAFAEKAGTGLTANGLADVLIASSEGRIDTLFVDPAASAIGTFDVESRRLAIDGDPRANSQDLIGLAAQWSHERGGRVYVAEPDDLNGAKLPAALLRF